MAAVLQLADVDAAVASQSRVRGQSGWNWAENGGAGAGGKMYGPATAEQAGCGKGQEYQVPEYFEHKPFSFYDLLKEINQLDKYQEQPVSGVSTYWSGRREI
jgi:hypothetical protein